MNMNITREDAAIIDQILARAKKQPELSHLDPLALHMDLTACHLNGNELRLVDLYKAPLFDFIHDVLGITSHMDRTSGKLIGFEPRYSRYIDLTPTWSAVLPIHLDALEFGNEAGKAAARKELTRLAQFADKINTGRGYAGEITARLVAILHEADKAGLDITDFMERGHDRYEAEKAQATPAGWDKVGTDHD